MGRRKPLSHGPVNFPKLADSQLLFCMVHVFHIVNLPEIWSTSLAPFDKVKSMLQILTTLQAPPPPPLPPLFFSMGMQHCTVISWLHCMTITYTGDYHTIIIRIIIVPAPWTAVLGPRYCQQVTDLPQICPYSRQQQPPTKSKVRTL